MRVSLFVPDFLDAWGDDDAFLDRVVAAYKGTGLRPRLHFLAFRASPGGCQVERSAAKPSGRCTMPYKVIGTHKRDNGSEFPLYKVTQNWNKDGYFKPLKAKLIKLRDRGITPLVSALDIRVRTGNDKYWDPNRSSVEALGPNTLGGVWGEPGKPGMMPYILRWFAVLFKTYVLPICPDAWGEACNEFNTPSFAHVPGDDFDWYMVEKCRPMMTAAMVKAGVLLSRTWTSGDLRNWRFSGGAFYSAHGIVRPENVKALPGVPNERLIISMDGGFQGAGRADCSKPPRKGASVEQTIGIVEEAVAMNAAEVEVMDRGMWARNRHVADLDSFDPATLRAATTTVKRVAK